MPNIIKTKQRQYTIGYTEESRLDDLIDIVREEMGDEVADELTEYFTNTKPKEYCDYLEECCDYFEKKCDYLEKKIEVLENECW